MYDLLFRRATIVDGSGSLRFVGDLAVQGEKIAAIGRLDDAQAARVIDADGLVLCPGFIDIHSHADTVIFRENAADLFAPLLKQGITTFVGGNCGMGMAPLPATRFDEFIDSYHEAFLAENVRDKITWSSMGEFMERLDTLGVPCNTGLLVPHGMIRLSAVGPETRHARHDEIAQMCRWLEESMDEGALGMSTGLQYFPGSQSETGELIDLARVLARYDGRYASHLRSYSATLSQAIDEAVLIAQEAGVHAQVSHLFWLPDFGPLLNKAFRGIVKAGSKIYEHVKFPVPSDSAAAQVLENIDRLRQSGAARIAVDAMPTSAGFTHLMAFFPPWVFAEANRQEIVGNLRDKNVRKRIRRDIEHGDTRAWPHDTDDTWSMNFFKMMGWASVSIMSVPSEKNKHLEGLNLVEIGKMWGMHPFDVACELLLQEDGKVLVFETLTYPGDDFIETSLAAPMVDPNTSIVTDSILMSFGLPSHLFYDCYPKFIGQYVRENRALSLEDGIRKCTGLSADSLGIKARGYLREGNFADLVLFDLATIKSNSTFRDPRHDPDGIRMVVVNGTVVVEENTYYKDTLAGHVLRR
ncbi:MAG: amidohydrolase family protein [Candidatus Lernaella stagnicola]|nr:amidohydrolase family protein [Candidatus Lernaella stagnicola]